LAAALADLKFGAFLNNGAVGVGGFETLAFLIATHQLKILAETFDLYDLTEKKSYKNNQNTYSISLVFVSHP